MTNKNKMAVNPNEMMTIIVGGSEEPLSKKIEAALHNLERDKLLVTGRRLGKQELSKRVLEAAISEINEDLIKSAKQQKEKPFYETLNEQKRRRSWRR